MQSQLSRAIEMHEAGQYEEAASAYKEILVDNQNDPTALNLLGIAYIASGKFAAALEVFSRAAALLPGEAEIQINLAETYRAMGEYEKAVESCNQALKLEPGSVEAVNSLGMVWADQGKAKEAAEQFRLALMGRPEFAAIHNNLGMALLVLLDFDGAERCFREAIKLQPSLASAHSNLGQLLLNCSRMEEALPLCRTATELQPQNAVFCCNLANTLRCLGRTEEAKDAFKRASELDPGLAESHTHAGLKLELEDRLREAFQLLRQATELEPENPYRWRHLAEFHQRQDFFDEAADYWKRVIDLEPEDPHPRTELSECMEHLARYQEAVAHCNEALRLNPNWVPARFQLATLQMEVGSIVEAESTLRATIPMAPAGAYARLGQLLDRNLPEADFHALEEHLVGVADVHMALLFSMGQVLDARQDYKRAAECFYEGNRLRLAQLKDTSKEYKQQAAQEFVDSMIHFFGPEFFDRMGGAGHASRRPVFIVGMPRSGTTLIEQILASHPAIHGAGELTLVSKAFRSIPSITHRAERPIDCISFLDKTMILELSDRHLKELDLIDGGITPRITDKLPENFTHLGLLAVMFPNATFIHCRRDIRDIAVSCWTTNFRMIPYACDFACQRARITGQ